MYVKLSFFGKKSKKITLKHHWNTQKKSMKHPWNTLESPLKLPRKPFDTSEKIFKTTLKHPLNTLGTPLEQPWKGLGTSFEHPWDNFDRGGLVGVSQNVDNNNFGHFIYIYKDLILHHLQWFFYKSTIYPSKCTNLQATIYNNLTSLVYTLQREFGPNLQSTK